MKKEVTMTFMLAAGVFLHAAEPWTVEQCMQYAAHHSHTVNRQRFALEDSRAEKTQAIGEFLPSIYGSVSGQVNFGRAIDPETNTYTDVSTLYNGYGLQASLTLFDGLQRYNKLRMTRAHVAMSHSAVQAEKDDVTLKVYKAYMELAYCQGAIEQTIKKRDESRALLHQTEVMAEVGQKSDADVAQMRATLAADEYELTHMHTQAIKAQLALKGLMNYPADSALSIVTPTPEPAVNEQPTQISAYAATAHPRIVQAIQEVESHRRRYTGAQRRRHTASEQQQPGSANTKCRSRTGRKAEPLAKHTGHHAARPAQQPHRASHPRHGLRAQAACLQTEHPPVQGKTHQPGSVPAKPRRLYVGPAQTAAHRPTTQARQHIPSRTDGPDGRQPAKHAKERAAGARA